MAFQETSSRSRFDLEKGLGKHNRWGEPPSPQKCNVRWHSSLSGEQLEGLVPLLGWEVKPHLFS